MTHASNDDSDGKGGQNTDFISAQCDHSGTVQFRMRGDDVLSCPGVLYNLGTTAVRKLRFVRSKGALSVDVDDKQVCSHAMTKGADYRKYKSAPLRFGGNNQASHKGDTQNTNLRLSDIAIVRQPFLAGVDAPCYAGDGTNWSGDTLKVTAGTWKNTNTDRLRCYLQCQGVTGCAYWVINPNDSRCFSKGSSAVLKLNDDDNVAGEMVCKGMPSTCKAMGIPELCLCLHSLSLFSRSPSVPLGWVCPSLGCFLSNFLSEYPDAFELKK